MKRIFTLITLLFLFGFSKAQDVTSVEASATSVNQGFYFGSVNLNENGKDVNYYRLRYMGDFPLGKFGLGIDIDLFLDQDGNIRDEDWDEWQDYLDKIYYIRYGEKGFDPFYIKLGGLDYSYIGFRNIFNGYSNMLEYPQRKKYGAETQIEINDFKLEMLMGDIKEMIDNSSTVVGGRLEYKVLGDLAIGGSFGADLNQYGVLLDDDGDDIVNIIDEYPDNKDYATKYEYHKNYYENTKSSTGQDYSQDMVNEFLYQDVELGRYQKMTKDSLEKYTEKTEALVVIGADISYPLIRTESVDFTIYSHATHIVDYGFGMALPGAIFNYNNVFKIYGEYRIQSDEFLFGYFNNTYEVERTTFHNIGGRLVGVPREAMLKGIVDPMQGLYVGMDFNILNFISLGATYQKMFSDAKDINSISGKLGILDGLIPNVKNAEIYYVQNNVEDFTEWKTPSTLMGARFTYNMGGVAMGLNYKLTFRDIDGDGLIRLDEEEIKTFEVTAGVTF
jgi:hypothetical protein